MDWVGCVRWVVTTSRTLGGSRQLREISRPAQVLPKLFWRPAGVVSGAAKTKEQQRHRTLICYCITCTEFYLQILAFKKTKREENDISLLHFLRCHLTTNSVVKSYSQ